MNVNDKLKEIIKEKTNIIFSCDVSTMKELLYFADLCGIYLSDDPIKTIKNI